MASDATLQRGRFAVCRDRTLAGCGGHHERGQVFAGHPITRWICCADCPARIEVASAREEDQREEDR